MCSTESINESVKDNVLSFAGDPTRALAASSGILREILECSICSSLMVEPYVVACGHSFCGECIYLWMREKGEDSTCPQCRTAIISEPVLSLELRNLMLAVVASWNLQAPEAPILESQLQLKPTPPFFRSGVPLRATYDAEDRVWRCPQCINELESRNWCKFCERRIVITQVEDQTALDALPSDFSDSDAMLTSVDSSDLSSFIDDDVSSSLSDDSEEETRQQSSNLAHRIRLDVRNLPRSRINHYPIYPSADTANRSIRNAIGPYAGNVDTREEENDDRLGNHAYAAERHDGESESFIDDSDIDSLVLNLGSGSDRSVHSCDELDDVDEVNDDEDDEDEDDDDEDDDDDGSVDSGNYHKRRREASDDSDDSMLDEFRNNVKRTQNVLADSDDSEVEVLAVRERPIVIDDDSD